jgi:hypothetical protein
LFVVRAVGGREREVFRLGRRQSVVADIEIFDDVDDVDVGCWRGCSTDKSSSLVSPLLPLLDVAAYTPWMPNSPLVKKESRVIHQHCCSSKKRLHPAGSTTKVRLMWSI